MFEPVLNFIRFTSDPRGWPFWISAMVKTFATAFVVKSIVEAGNCDGSIVCSFLV
jgi:hypothetical protein